MLSMCEVVIVNILAREWQRLRIIRDGSSPSAEMRRHIESYR